MTDTQETAIPMKDMILYSLRTFPETSITFTKKDGTERVLLCTLLESALPQREDSDAPKREHSPDVQPVWDLEAKGWRSFRWDSIVSFRSMPNKEII
jgi:hypothetical protein